MTRRRLYQQIRGFLARRSGPDEGEFTRLYDGQLERILNYVRYRLGPAEAEDVTAVIFSRAWSQRETFDPQRGTLEAWLWGIARNAVIDALRRRAHAAGPMVDDPAQPDMPHAEAEWRDEWLELHAALCQLAPIDQEIITLRFGAQHTNREIASLLDLSESNVAQRLRRSLHKMRRYLEGNGWR